MENSTVNVWEEKVMIPTYGVGKPEKNPMFFEKRIYQGSSGVVYPNPVIEKIYDEKADKEYRGLFLENDYLKIMILPELGGRIHMAYDKIKERHFIYYNQVIKPALVGLTGPWISGGIEFNWPQHHRPSTFDAIDYKLEENNDGSKTVWVNEIEQMFHTKGMAGFTLYPDKAYIEIKAKLLNRSSLPQTFLWWANPAVKVNDYYQSVFPSDVNAVFDHGKRDVSEFPIAKGTYYKVDYAPGTDISMYKNIPVPTSYMAINSEYDFVGGYEHDTQAGVLHVANHHVSPGKKQWTWGHSDFGQAWDRNLTDADGPYIELMTGMFTDNQPDFTWLLPNEEKSFTQYFLPYVELGVVKNATKDILLAINKQEDQAHIKIYVTSLQKNLIVRLSHGDKVLSTDSVDIDPRTVYTKKVAVDSTIPEEELLLQVFSNDVELIRYEPAMNKKNEIPAPAKPAVEPENVESNEQLFFTGQHLEQYRHATYSPVPYYEKALERDPKDSRCNNALGLWYLRRGQFEKAEPYFKKAIETIAQRNPNPYDTDAYYNLGLCLKFLNRPDDAYKAFYKSTWSRTWKDSGFFAVAQIDMAYTHFDLVLAHTELAIENNANNSKSYVLQAAAYRKTKQYDLALSVTILALQKDPFNLGALYEQCLCFLALERTDENENALKQLLELSRGEAQNFMAYALDYAAAGMYREAYDFLKNALTFSKDNPMVFYSLAFFSYHFGDELGTTSWLNKAAAADSYLCFPNRLEEINILKLAITLNSTDAKAPYYLGNLYYDKRQYAEAIRNWELSEQLDAEFPTVLRNLGIANYNKLKDPAKALAYFERAFELDNSDARLLMELDQLYKRLNRNPQERAAFLEKNIAAVLERDDLYLERVALLNFNGAFEEAHELIMSRKFHPWEGGEGKASGQYVYGLIRLARKALSTGAFNEAIALLERAQEYPHHLGEGKLFGTQENDIWYWMGCTYEGLNDLEASKHYFRKATLGLDEPSAAVFYNDQQPDKIFYQGLAWNKLGDTIQAEKVFNGLINYANKHVNDEVKMDYFAVSLPNLLIFDDELKMRNEIHCHFMEGLGKLGLGRKEEAHQAFSKVLSLDAEHLGAKTHLEFLQDA
jgi:tetratricopeptide (TPR) repeat protein